MDVGICSHSDIRVAVKLRHWCLMMGSWWLFLLQCCLVGFRCELYAGQSSSSTSDSHFAQSSTTRAALCCLQRSDIWPHLLACVLSFCTCRTPSASVRGENTNPWSVFHLLVGVRGCFWCFPYIWAMLAALKFKQRTPSCISLRCSKSLL